MNRQPQSSPRFVTEDLLADRDAARYAEEQCRNCDGTGRVPYPGYAPNTTDSVTCGRCVGYRRVFIPTPSPAGTPTPIAPVSVDFEREPASDREPFFSVGPDRVHVGSPYTIATTVSVDPMALGREVSTWSTEDLAALLVGLSLGLSDQELGNSQLAKAAKYADEHLTRERDRGVLGNFAYVLGNNTKGIGSVAA